MQKKKKDKQLKYFNRQTMMRLLIENIVQSIAWLPHITSRMKLIHRGKNGGKRDF